MEFLNFCYEKFEFFKIFDKNSKIFHRNLNFVRILNFVKLKKNKSTKKAQKQDIFINFRYNVKRFC